MTDGNFANNDHNKYDMNGCDVDSTTILDDPDIRSEIFNSQFSESELLNAQCRGRFGYFVVLLNNYVAV